MKLLKKIVHVWKTKRKLFVIGGIICFILGLFIYLAISLVLVSSAEIALSRLEQSFKEEIICHEQCYLARSAWEKLVANDLKKNNKRIAQRLEMYWRDPETSERFKLEIINIIYSAHGVDRPPRYLVDYFSDPTAETAVLREIILRFNRSAFAQYDLAEIFRAKISLASSSEEKIEAIKTLSDIQNDSEINNYFTLLITSSELEIKRESIKSISSIKQKSKYFTLDQLQQVKSMALASETDKRLRRDLVYLLADYYLIYPLESLAAWQAIYENLALDSLSRAFSADNLNHLASKGLSLPEISVEEWADYYNQ